MDENQTNNLVKSSTNTNQLNSTCPYSNQNISNAQTSATNTIINNLMYTQGYLRTQIGKLVRVQFLIGTNNLQDRTGILTSVGASYIILRSLESGTDIFCDIYSIKFVTIANQQMGIYNGISV